MNTLVTPAPSAIKFDNGISHPELYIWDAWSLTRRDGTISLFTLSQPRSSFSDDGLDLQRERDVLPHHWRRFDSSDDGDSWADLGAVFTPNLDNHNAFDARSIWTGSVACIANKVYAAYTGIAQVGEDHPFLQSLGLAIENPETGYFVSLSEEPLLCPRRDYELIQSKGYYLGPKTTLGHKDGEEDQCALAWRDPELFEDDCGRVHLFWAAKAVENALPKPAIGHALLSDLSTKPTADLLPPIRLSDESNITQAEVPQLIYDKRQSTYFMMVSTTNKRCNDQTDADGDLSVKIYGTDTLSGALELKRILLTNSDKRYPGTWVQHSNGRLSFTAPYNRASSPEKIHTMPALTPIDLG